MLKKWFSVTFAVVFYLLQLPLWAAEPVIIPDVKLKSKITSEKKSVTSIAATTFTKAEVKQSPVINLSQFLKQEQSVVRLTKNSGDSSQTALSIRGFGDNAAANSLILIDGFPLTNPSLLAPNFNSIPLTNIERIDIFPGSAGSLWGDQAVGGIVNIITKHPRKFFLNAILSAGSYSSYYENILCGDHADNGLFFKVFALIGKTNNYRDHNQHQANNVAAQVGMDYSRGTISLNIQTYGDTIYFPGWLSEDQFIQHPRMATNFKNYCRYRTNLFQILNTHELSNQWILETRFNYHETDGNGFVYFKFNTEDSLTSINPRLLGRFKNNKLILGYFGQMSHYQMVNSKVRRRSRAQQNHVYLQTTFAIIDYVDFVFGMRKAWQQNQIETKWGKPVDALDHVFVTEQAILFHPTETLSFFVRRDGNFSFPKANEETWLPENVKSLAAQSGVSYEVGGAWQTEKFKTQLNLYRLILNNEIAFKPEQTPKQPVGSFFNFDKTMRQGFGFSQHICLTPKITLHGQFNYVDARFASGKFSGKRIPAVPAINANAGFDYVFSEQWLVQYNLIYSGNRYASEDLQNVGKKLPGYWLNDIALQYFLKSFIFVFEIHNLFNKNYVNYAFYDSIPNRISYYPAAGRNYLLTLKMNFD